MRHNGFVNLQQYYLEAFLVEALQREPLAELRWLNRVDAIDSPADGGPVTLRVHTPEGDYRTQAEWVIACDGANSPLRQALGLRPEVYDRNEDRWIIIDVVLRGTSWPEERWTWLDAGSNHGRAVWRHKMADDTWRLDFQLRPDEDAQAACTPQAMRQRVWDLLGEQVDFDIAWHGVWAYRHECLPGLRHGRVLFAGDSAHLVAPFGARGGNGGIQDADNLGWKLALVLQGRASDTLLDSYSAERKHAALENIRQARRSSRFVHPGPAESARMWRDAIIALAPRHDVPARMINTGRLCMPAIYPPSPLAHPASPHAGRALPNVVLDRRAALTAPAARPLVHRPGLRRPRTGHPGAGRRRRPAASRDGRRPLRCRGPRGAAAPAGRGDERRSLADPTGPACDGRRRCRRLGPGWRRPAGLDRRRALPLRPPASPDAHSPSNAGAHAHAPVAAAA